MNELRDEELMEMFCAGKTGAFQFLFEKYRNRIFRFIYATYERNPARAEDYTQEVFLRVIEKRDSFNPAMCFSSWLYTIARNYCLNQFRSKTPYFEMQVDVLDRLGYENPSGRADKKLLDKELGAIIRKAVSKLPENLRAVFVMREIEGLPHSEISEILNLSEANVRIQLHRAKKQLQQLITPYLEDKK
jgi:RNA polymerase sigma-70 factor (ECF subfamily)